jgi:hypothetical protein
VRALNQSVVLQQLRFGLAHLRDSAERARADGLPRHQRPVVVVDHMHVPALALRKQSGDAALEGMLLRFTLFASALAFDDQLADVLILAQDTAAADDAELGEWHPPRPSAWGALAPWRKHGTAPREPAVRMCRVESADAFESWLDRRFGFGFAPVGSRASSGA